MLLATKLFNPAIHAAFVGRPRLLEKLQSGLTCRLTLVAAPAGFGKSTLVSSWLQAQCMPNGWLSLDEADNDPVRFLTYLHAALQSAARELASENSPNASTALPSLTSLPSMAALLQRTPPPSTEMLITALINDLAALPARCVLVLDDYHQIHTQSIHEALIFLLENAPPTFHLILISRADPPFPLARWRVRREINEIRADDLRFQVEEAATLLNSHMGLALTPRQIEELERRTEGWIAALQLAILSMQNRDDLAGFIDSFRGSHHFVLDYLTDEVLHKQPVSRRDFLLRTSILERFGAPLCAALLAANDAVNPDLIQRAQTELEALDQANLFVIALDDERRWYRYHHLFAEFLRKRLADQLPPAEQQTLYQRAAIWCDRQGQDEEAIRYALQSEDSTLIVTLIGKYVQIAMGRSELHKILHWFEALSRAGIALTPRFKIWRAWAMLFSGEPEKLAALISELETLAEDSLPGSDLAKRGITGNLAALRGWLALFRGKPAQTVDLVALALEALPPDELYIRGNCYLNLGYAQLMLGNLRGAVQSLREGLAIAESSGHLITAVFARTYLANAQAQQGDLYAAERGYQHAIAQTSEAHQHDSAATGIAYIGLSQLLREWHRLDESAALIERACEMLQQSRNDAMLNEALSAKARTQVALGQIEAALATLDQSNEIARASGQTMQPAISSAHRAWIHLRFGDAEVAYRWAAEQTPPQPHSLALDGYRTALLLGGIWGIESPAQAQRACEMLRWVWENAKANGYAGVMLQVTLLQAVACQTAGELEMALSHLTDALTQAESQGYIYQFVSIGAPMQQLLAQALQRGLFPDYVCNLLAAFPSSEPPIPAIAAPETLETGDSARPPQPLFEPLSERELEVLALLAQGCSNAEIAERLIITVGTTKRHVSNIFGKLGVGSRTQAVAYGREVGLLDN